MENKIVVLLSGGVDSVLLAAMAHKEGRLAGCVCIDYGQPAKMKEYSSSLNWCTKAGIPMWFAYSPLLGMAKMKEEGSTGPRVVPARNAVLLALAVNYAVTIGATAIWYGANRDDNADYPDCRETFFGSMGEALEAAYGVQVEAPLIDLNKSEILQRLDGLGVELDDCWSCYEGGEAPCGVCASCRARV